MIATAVKEAFNFPADITIEQLSTGHINYTYKVLFADGQAFLLQSINPRIFGEPERLQQNYRKIRQQLLDQNSYILPGILNTRAGELLYKGAGEAWRCFEYIPDTYSPLISSTPEQAWLVASCFGQFSARLSGLEPTQIQTVLPGFHDLGLRFAQFSRALVSAPEKRRLAAAALVRAAMEHQFLVKFFVKVQSSPREFPLHILHHDCKIANILFKQGDGRIYSPIDLDTTQPGVFISDIGDMIRSMVPNYSENHPAAKELAVREDFYAAIREGYLDTMHTHLSTQEIAQIDMSGQLIVYMQALRFLTDYLNEDIYYQISYPEQNLDRASNQFRLLELLIRYVEGRSRSPRKVYTSGK